MSTTPIPASPVPAAAPVLVRAASLEQEWYSRSALWFGPTGEALTGTQAAVHLDAALAVLERDGWSPTGSFEDRFGINEAISGDADLFRVSERCLELILCANSGAWAVSFELWEQKAGRTFAEVRTLLTVAAEFARTYGPTLAPLAVTA